MNIAVATDSNSGLTRDMLRPGLFLLPMPVIIDGQLYAEGVDIDHPRLYEAMRQDREISSSQPSPGQLMELWDGIFAQGYDQIVYIPMSSGLSDSCRNATQLAADYGGRVQVVDNHRISVTQLVSVHSALALAAQERSAAEIRAHLEARAYDASIYITVDALDRLKKGGRVTPAVAAFATILNLKPVLTIQGDKLDTFAKVRGMRQAELKMIEAVRQDLAGRFADVPAAELQVETAGTFESAEQAERWRRQVQEAFPAAKVSYAQLPCSIACHVGMNAVGIGILRREA